MLISSVLACGFNTGRRSREKLPGSQGSLAGCVLRDTPRNSEILRNFCPHLPGPHCSLGRNHKGTFLNFFFFFKFNLPLFDCFGEEEKKKNQNNEPEQEKESPGFGNHCWLCRGISGCSSSEMPGAALGNLVCPSP